MELLRFITCGSVDHGKSTLIGRILYDSKALLRDQVAALERSSAKGGISATGVMLFGLSFLYGLTGTTSLPAMGLKLQPLLAHRWPSWAWP